MKSIHASLTVIIAVSLIAAAGCSGRKAAVEGEGGVGPAAEPGVEGPLFGPGADVEAGDEGGAAGVEVTPPETAAPSGPSPVKIVGVDFDEELDVGKVFGHTFQGSGGSGQYVWKAEGSVPSGLSFYCGDDEDVPCSGKMLHFDGVPSAAGDFDIKVTLADKADEANSDSLEFQLEIEMEEISTPPGLGEDVCDKPLSLEVDVLDTTIEPSVTAVLGPEMKMRARLMRGDGPAYGSTYWQWESKVRDSHRCQLVPGSKNPIAYVFAPEGACQNDQGRWTKNPTWESEEIGPASMIAQSAIVPGNTINLEGVIKYDGPFNMSKLRTDGKDDPAKKPVEEFTLYAMDSCPIDTSKRFGKAIANLELNIMYPVQPFGEPLKDMNVWVRYKDAKWIGGMPKKAPGPSGGLMMSGKFGTMKVVFKDAEGEKLYELVKTLKHDADCVDGCTKELSRSFFALAKGGYVDDIRSVWLVFDLEDQSIGQFSSKDFDFVDLESLTFRTKYYWAKFSDDRNLFTESGVPPPISQSPEALITEIVGSATGRFVDEISYDDFFNTWETSDRGTYWPYDRRQWPDYD